MLIRILCLYLIWLFAACWGMVSAAVSPEAVKVEITPSTYQLALGDSLSIFCTVTRPEGIRTGEPYPADDNFLVDISKQWHKTAAAAPGTIIDRYCFLTYVFAPDTLRVGPFRVNYTNPDSGRDSAESNVLTFVISGFVTDQESPPKPNRRPFGIAAKGIPLRAVIAIILIAIVIISIIIYLIRRRKPVPLAAIEKPIDEIGEFERIRSMKLHESGRIKELYSLTSSAMRGFMHRNMGFEAMYDTTEEILYHLYRKTGDRKVSDSIREIFMESDMVKFAKLIPPAEKSSTVIDRVLVPVRKTLDEIRSEKERLAIREAIQEKSAAGKSIKSHAKGGN